MKWLTGLAAGLALSAGTVHAADKWDMPTAYVDSNYHTQNAKLFAEAVGVCTGGDLEIVVHGGGTLFKGGEIKRAVQTGRAPIGERLLSAHQNENAVFGFDSVPFLASSFEASDRLWQAARGKLTEILAEQNLVLLYAVPWPPQGMYFEREIGGVADMGGIKLTFVSPLSRSDGHDCFGLIDELVPGLATGLNDGVVIFEDAVREPVLPEVLPDVLDRV